MASGRTNRPKIARWQKATALIPLALLAGAWTASLGSPTTATADSAVKDPGVPAVPTTSFDQPASYTHPSDTTFPEISSNGNQPALDSPSNPSSVSANGIPTAAMAAYQRAETVMDKADPSCHITWALVAAIGRVESDHGRYGGNVLSAEGVATPGIFGLPLNGSHDTALISDTDGGGYDHDPVYDRAVGPMQFIPSTWDIVGVDADGDGQKNPQDIDDAALATAVYLCAGSQDLGTTEGQKSAVFSYNHSEQYVALVLSIMNAYLDGNYSEVADGLPVSTFIPAKPAAADHPRHHGSNPQHLGTRKPHAPGTRAPNTGPAPGNPGSNNPAPNQPAPNNPNPGPSNPSTPNPTTSTPTVPPAPDPAPTVEKVVLTAQQAKAKCVDKLSGFAGSTSAMITGCTNVLTGLTPEQAASKLSGGTLAAVLTNLGLSNLIPSVPTVTAPSVPGTGG